MAIDGLEASRRLIPIGPPGPRPPVEGAERAPGEFRKILESELDGHRLKFSAHAQKRIEQSPVSFGRAEVDRVARAVNLAESKGSRESLVLLDNMALVVSVKNRTVITAVDMQRMKDNIFTNIDSAVIV
ncbi:MAG: flagellar protein [Firmicutes bacterium]|nr:flagellar protein [Bacillota bacterium]